MLALDPAASIETISGDLRSTVAIVVTVFVVATLALSWWVRSKIHDAEDFVVAGRRLPLGLAAPTLLATWFGAGTLLTATDEIREGGIRMAALDPLGAGLCLLLAGALIARPLWRMKLLTFADFFARRFGPRAERWASILMVPTYFGWIAAQMVALAGILELFFGIELRLGIALVALLGMTYTWLGGMWSVTLTDAFLVALMAVGLVVLTWTVLTGLGDGSLVGGIDQLQQRLPPEDLVLVPRESAAAFVGWVGVVAIGSLGNLPGQDLTQRIFASKSERTAAAACYVAGAAYLLLGVLPVTLGVAAGLLVPGGTERATLPLLASTFLTPTLAAVFVVVVCSAILSTLDSAILSPSTVIAHNLIPPRIRERWGQLRLDRMCVAGVTLGATLTAYLGEDAYEMLESAYELGLVSLLVPLLAGLHSTRGDERASLLSMATGTGLWLVHFALGWETFLAPTELTLPRGLSCAALAALVYAAAARRS